MEPGHSGHEQSSRVYDFLAFLLRNAPAQISIVMWLIGLATVFGLTDGRFYAGIDALVSITGAYTILSVTYLIYKWRRENANRVLEAAFLLAFHSLTALFVLFVSGFLSVFLAVWIVLLVISDARFGTKGLLASFVAFCLTALASINIHAHQLSGSEQAEVVQGVIAVSVIGFVISRIRALSEHQQTTLAKTREEELYQRERLLALVNSMGDAMAATDDQGVIKMYNSTMLNLLDTNEDLNEKPIDKVLQLRDKDNRPISIIDEAKKKRTIFSRNDVSRKLAYGDSVKLYVNVAPIQPGYQSHAERGYIIILRDITKEKTLEEERDEFVSVVSHELRTPVTIAEGNLSNIRLLFERGAEKPMLVKAVDDAHEQIIYLAKLVNDLSTLAKAERGTGGQAEVINLSEVLQEAHKEYSPQAQAKNLQFNLDITPNLPSIKANPLYLQEVLQNLITNAIKYTQQGSVTVKAHVGESNTVSIDVTDTGIGISKSDQEHVFEKFYRSEDYRTRESSGTGLGLYVVKRLAEKQGFKINMTSRLNHGSTFSLVIPATHATVVQAPKPQVANAAPAK